MPTTTDNLTWRNVDPTDIPPAALALYTEYKALQRQAAAARDKFEAEFSLSLGITPDHAQRIVFGYKFGKLSIAVAPNDKPKPKPRSAQAATLADFLAAHGTVRSL